MRKRYKRILYFIGILIIGCVLLGVTALFYDRMTGPSTEVEVIGELSVNYINGHTVSAGTYEFSITNNGSNDLYYEILLTNLKNYTPEAQYSLYSTEANLNIIDTKLDNNTNILASNILIPMGTTQNFKIKFSSPEETTFSLKINKTIDSKEYFYMTLLNNNPINEETLTKVGEEPALSYEGLIKDYDDLGQTYYFRGNITNNYVKFADTLWRIVRINGDGTVKLVLNSSTGVLTSYNETMENYEDYGNTNLAKALDTYYETYLQSYDNYITAEKYCIAPISSGETTKIYNAYNRLATDKIPTFNCLGTTYNNKIGLLTADEIVFAGATTSHDNKNYYLYNSDIKDIWWTATLAQANSTEFYPFAFSTTGRLISNTSGLLNRELRPTISLNRKVTVTGEGTVDNPYIPSID